MENTYLQNVSRKRKEFYFFYKIDCQENTHKKIKFIFIYFISLHFFKKSIFHTSFATTEHGLKIIQHIRGCFTRVLIDKIETEKNTMKT